MNDAELHSEAPLPPIPTDDKFLTVDQKDIDTMSCPAFCNGFGGVIFVEMIVMEPCSALHLKVSTVLPEQHQRLEEQMEEQEERLVTAKARMSDNENHAEAILKTFNNSIAKARSVFDAKVDEAKLVMDNQNESLANDKCINKETLDVVKKGHNMLKGQECQCYQGQCLIHIACHHYDWMIFAFLPVDEIMSVLCLHADMIAICALEWLQCFNVLHLLHALGHNYHKEFKNLLSLQHICDKH